jgi:uncharacterized integral membrane protein
LVSEIIIFIHPPAEGGGDIKMLKCLPMKISTIVSLLIGIIALLFAFQNNDNIILLFFNWSFNGSLALIIIATLFIGFFIGLIMFVPSSIKAKLDLRKMKKEVENLQKIIDENDVINFESEGLGKEGEKFL